MRAGKRRGGKIEPFAEEDELQDAVSTQSSIFSGQAAKVEFVG
jgi:hypothetical protein